MARLPDHPDAAADEATSGPSSAGRAAGSGYVARVVPAAS